MSLLGKAQGFGVLFSWADLGVSSSTAATPPGTYSIDSSPCESVNLSPKMSEVEFMTAGTYAKKRSDVAMDANTLDISVTLLNFPPNVWGLAVGGASTDVPSSGAATSNPAAATAARKGWAKFVVVDQDATAIATIVVYASATLASGTDLTRGQVMPVLSLKVIDSAGNSGSFTGLTV